MSLAVEHVSSMPLVASPLKISTMGRGRLDTTGDCVLQELYPMMDDFDDNNSTRRRRSSSAVTSTIDGCESEIFDEDETDDNSTCGYDCSIRSNNSTFDSSEESVEEFSCSTKKEATEILRKFHEVPNDFVATAVVRADANVVQTARDTLKLDKKLATMASVVFPFVLPVFWLQRDMREISAKLTVGAEDDVYVTGNKGYATLNKGHLKAWTHAYGHSLEEDSSMFKSDSCAGCFRLTKARQQSVLAVNEYGTGQCMQLWFVNPRTQRFLSSSAYTCRSSMKSMKDLAFSEGELL